MTPSRAITLGLLVSVCIIAATALAQSTRPAPARDWPPMVHFIGEGRDGKEPRQFGSTWSLAQVPRIGETVKLAGLTWEVVGVEWVFDSSDEGATLLSGDVTVKVRRKTR